MIATYTAESYWFNVLTDQDRQHYERCITAIMAYYSTRARWQFSYFMTNAKWYAITSPLVAAIVWRLQEEVSDYD